MLRARLVLGIAVLLSLATAGTGDLSGATPKEIDAAIQKGAAYLKKSGGTAGKNARDANHVGSVALAGLALLEAGTPTGDPATKKITEAIRDAAYTETRTYQISLCIFYLDRNGDPADQPLIQMLGVRLLAGQNVSGGWTYECISPVSQATERALRAKLGDATLTAGGKQPAAPKAGTPPATGTDKLPVAGKLHADVERYRQGLLAGDTKKTHLDDNSNTQFGILGIWVCRKHGVPVEHALDLIEKRFLTTQNETGGWPYIVNADKRDGSPSMTCAGLLGLATAIGRREEKRLKAELATKPAPKEPGKVNSPEFDPNDPFFNPPKPDPAKKAEPAPKGKQPPADNRDAAVKLAFDSLATTLAHDGGKGKGKGKGNSHDLYFLWSLERVGVIYGIEQIGKTDWYDYGAAQLIPAQNADGSWGGRGGYGPDVNTAFAMLFLSRANIARDLSASVQRNPSNAELRAGLGLPTDKDPIAKSPDPAPMPKNAENPKPFPPIVPVPMPNPPKPVAGTSATEIALELTRARGAEWTATLTRIRDAKGAENTSALLAVIPLLDGEQKKAARDALAERLCRMTAVSLRGMLKADDAELRRAAALACAMKDDKTHIPDLIEVLNDKDENVVKVTRAALKSLTNQNFATLAEWREWYAKEKK